VPFIDSAGLEYLLDLQEKLAQRMGQVKLIKPDENIRKILELTRLASVFEVFKDIPEAVKAIHA
jgi:anti-anti-sigma factor